MPTKPENMVMIGSVYLEIIGVKDVVKKLRKNRCTLYHPFGRQTKWAKQTNTSYDDKLGQNYN